MPIQYDTEWDGRRLTVAWMPPPFRPPREQTIQASGLCFTDDRMVVLVSTDGATWTLPGGTREAGETAAEALQREVREEACAQVRRFVYLGCQRVDDPDNPAGPVRYYQTRFWARVTLEPFAPAFETIARKLVAPEEVRATLSWGTVPIVAVLLARALEAERRAVR